MPKKSAKEYISTNDFEGCLDRWEHCKNIKWSAHWFDTLVTIYENAKEWSKKYIIDPIEKTVTRIADCIKKTATKVKTLCEDESSYTYLINMFDESNNHVFTKIGKANNTNRRFKELCKTHYSRENVTISRIEPIYVFQCRNDDLSQVLESFIRNLFRKTRDFIPNDRFKPFTPSEEEWKEMERYYKLVCAE